MIINGNDVAEVVVGSQQANGSDLFPEKYDVNEMGVIRTLPTPSLKICSYLLRWNCEVTG